jgi:hypothetical protein
MLSKEEELRVNHYVEITRGITNPALSHLEATGLNFKWLATKLKETNDELGKVTEELQNANELSAKLSERFE